MVKHKEIIFLFICFTFTEANEDNIWSGDDLFLQAGTMPFIRFYQDPEELSHIKQEHYWDSKLFPFGFKIPCWHNSIPSSNLQNINTPVKRTWFKFLSGFSDLIPLNQLDFVVDELTKSLEFSPFRKLDDNEAQRLTFLCVLHEVPNRNSSGAASFFELHHVHLPPARMNRQRQSELVFTRVKMSFRTTARDPYPPGCSHTIGYTPEDDKCTAQLSQDHMLPELIGSDMGIIMDNSASMKEHLTYMRQTLLEESELICMQYGCESTLTSDAFWHNCLITDTLNNFTKMIDKCPTHLVQEIDQTYNPISNAFHWMPQLQFIFKSQLIDCDVVKPIFDVLTSSSAEKNFGETAWSMKSDFQGLLNQFESAYLRRQDVAHQVYYSPSVCLQFDSGDTSSHYVFPRRVVLDPSRGFTILWSVLWNKPKVFNESVPIIWLKKLTAELLDDIYKPFSIEVECADRCEIKMKFNYKKLKIIVNSAHHLARNVSLLLGPNFANVSLKNVSLNLLTFAILVDGPEFVTETHDDSQGNDIKLIYRRIRFFCNEHLVTTGRLKVPFLKVTKQQLLFQGTEFSIDGSAHFFEKGQYDVTFKILNWPDYDLVSRVPSRFTTAWRTAGLGCLRTANQPIFNLTIWSNSAPLFHIENKSRNAEPKLYWASNHRLCQTACRMATFFQLKDNFDPYQYVCYAANQLTACDPTFSMDFTFTADKFDSQWRLNLTQYRCDFRQQIYAYSQFTGELNVKKLLGACNGSFVAFDTNKSLLNVFTAGAGSTPIDCSSPGHVFQLHPSCKLRKKIKMAPGYDSIQLILYPIIEQCQQTDSNGNAIASDDLISKSEEDETRLLTTCPPGQHLSRDPPIQCEPCPADTFSDAKPEDDGCIPCPALRPTTYNMSGASSCHCSNALINGERRRLLYKLANRIARAKPNGGSGDGNELLEQPFENLFAYQETENDLFSYLAPASEFIRDQRLAEKMYQELTQLTFSSAELFFIFIMAVGLALICASLTYILIIGGEAVATEIQHLLVQTVVIPSRKILNMAQELRNSLEHLMTIKHDRRQTWEKRFSEINRKQDANIFRKASLEREKKAFNDMTMLEDELVETILRYAEEKNNQRLEGLQSPIPLPRLERDRLRVLPYSGPQILRSYLSPPRKELPRFFFFNEAGLEDEDEDDEFEEDEEIEEKNLRS